ncbi:MAG: lysozyme [Chryseobacterium sp.]|nr:lysozyme [Chryseobacterium sp.]
MKKSKRIIKYIVVHCTATKEGVDFHASDIDKWHKARGFNSIGYNYVVTLNGDVELGRDVDLVPAHVAGYNSNSIGVVYVGGGDANNKPKDTRNQKQKDGLVRLLRELRKLYPNAVIQGHRDFPKVNKACPCFDAKPEYRNI